MLRVTSHSTMKPAGLIKTSVLFSYHEWVSINALSYICCQKVRKVKVLKDEPIISETQKEKPKPGTLAFLAQKDSGGKKGSFTSGPVCGQCDIKEAVVVSQHYFIPFRSDVTIAIRGSFIRDVSLICFFYETLHVQ